MVTRNTRPIITVLAHHGFLINDLAQHNSLREHVTVRPLVRELGFMNPFTTADVDKALDGSKVLVLCPMRHSMCPSSPVFEIERYAAVQAHAKRIWIGIVVVEHECAYPPYMEAHRSSVMALATFDDRTETLRRCYQLASHKNLFALPETKPEPHAHFRRQAERRHLPEHLSAFGRILVELASHPYH